MLQTKPRYALILNRVRYQGQTPFEVVPGVNLDRATEIQTLEIIRFISIEGGLSPFGKIWYYTANPRPKESEGSYTYSHVPIENVEFWVLNHNFGDSLQKLKTAFKLVEPEIEWGAALAAGSRSVETPTVFHFFQANLNPEYSEVTRAHLLEVRELSELIDAAKADTESLAKASLLRILENFSSSRSYIRIGHMALLSHFTLIEGLLTHSPKPFAGDSLNHQLSTKIPLLFQRMAEKVDHVQFFGNIEISKLWKKLYAVRSAFAHGDRADFTGEFSQLKNFQTVERYVYLSMKALLRLALREPQLIYDLRSC